MDTPTASARPSAALPSTGTLSSVGVLAFQGSVEPHVEALVSCGVSPHLVRRPADLDSLTHLVLPGGESTTLHHLLTLFSLWEPIRKRGQDGTLALLGTCAGAILLGHSPPDSTSRHRDRPPRMDLIDVEVERNAYGAQVDSFVATVDLLGPLERKAHGSPGEKRSVQDGVFIRAPRLKNPGRKVEILGTLRGEPVLVREGRTVVATFHPELSESQSSIHEWFLTL